MSARFMHQDFFEYVPQFRLIIAGNHKPSIRNIDQAMRRPLHMIPFTVTIPPAQRDHKLPKKLIAERDDRILRFPPCPEAIDRMKESMRWVLWLAEEERHLVWLRAKEWEWKEMARRTNATQRGHRGGVGNIWAQG